MPAGTGLPSLFLSRKGIPRWKKSISPIASACYGPKAPTHSPDADRPRWGERTQADLGIETLAGYLSPDPRTRTSILSFLLPLTTDTGIIRYRQEVLEDFLRVPEVAAVFGELQEPLLEIERLGGPPPAEQTPLQKTLYRMGELELYVDCVEKLWTVLSAGRGKIKSTGLRELLEHLAGVRSRPAFRTMVEELPKLRMRYDTIAGITIGVNLDEGLHPIGATLLSIRHKPFKDGTFLSKLFGKGSPEDEQGIAPIHELPLKRVYGTYASVETYAREDPELFPLFKDLDVILTGVTKPIAQILTAVPAGEHPPAGRPGRRGGLLPQRSPADEPADRSRPAGLPAGNRPGRGARLRDRRSLQHQPGPGPVGFARNRSPLAGDASSATASISASRAGSSS